MTTQSDKTIIGFLGDESGSMGGQRKAMVDGHNEFVGKIRKDAAGKDVKLITGFFDSRGNEPILRIRLEGDLAESRELTSEDYRPHGGTPLRDATAQMIGKLDALRKGGEKMMLVIFTDGGENASTEVSPEQLNALIRDKEDEGWEFLYLGANQDAWGVGHAMGMSADKSYLTTSTNEGVAATMDFAGTRAASRVTLSDEDYKSESKDIHRRSGGQVVS